MVRVGSAGNSGEALELEAGTFPSRINEAAKLGLGPGHLFAVLFRDVFGVATLNKRSKIDITPRM